MKKIKPKIEDKMKNKIRLKQKKLLLCWMLTLWKLFWSKPAAERKIVHSNIQTQTQNEVTIICEGKIKGWVK